LFQLPPREPVQFPTAELEIDPYVLGAWLGDGKATGASICGAEDDLKQVVNGWPEAYPNSWSSVHKTTGVVYLGFRHMVPRLRKLVVLGNKHIPDAYKFASISLREQLLAGLIDTDVHVDKTQRIRIATVSDQLASDIEDVVRS